MGQQIKRFFHLFEGIYTPGICGLAQAKERLWGLVYAVEFPTCDTRGYWIYQREEPCINKPLSTSLLKADVFTLNFAIWGLSTYEQFSASCVKSHGNF